MALPPSPCVAKAHASQMAPWVYCPPFSRMPGRIALDVAGLERGVGIEGRREEEGDPVVRPHQLALGGGDRGRGVRRVGGAGEHRPGLGDRIDPAGAAARGAERRAVVEIGAPVPGAVPAVLFQRGLELPRRGRASARRGRRGRAARRAARGAARVAHRNQPSQTLSPLPPAPTRFMPSFQSPVPISGRPCAPVARFRSMPRTQCSKSGCVRSTMRGW